MPSKNFNQQVGKNSTAKNQSKAAGTRWGTLQDWRAASKDGEKTPDRHGCAIRDGRR